jgi:methanesulfonate monooxygenase large subunit
MTIAFAKPNVPDEYLVDNRVYTDHRTFELERERIFLKTWNFVCHESEISRPGDYIATSVADVPIIVCRNKSGELRAFYNTCRHRAAQVVRDDGGNAASFTCFYHLWSYDLDGTLIGAPEIEAYKTSYCPAGLGKDDLSLVPVRIETNARMIFVCFDQDTPSLAQFLGPALASEMHGPFGDPRVCIEVVWKKILRANWKMAAENSRDGYHAPLLHKRLRGVSPPRPFKIHENSHTIQRMDIDYENGRRLGTLDGILAEKPEMIDAFLSHPLPGLSRENPAMIITLYPDFLSAVRYNTYLILKQTPLTLDQTLVEARGVYLSDDSDEVREIRRIHWDYYWSEGAGNVPEDWEAWESQQIGVKGLGSRYSVMARGEDGDEGMRNDDNRIRAFWAQWRKNMGATSNGPVRE